MKKLYFFAVSLMTLGATAQTIDFEDLTLPGAQEFWNGSDLSGDFMTGSGPIVTMQNYYDTAWGGYWAGGFAYTNQVSDTMTGLNGQYSTYADGGMGGSGVYTIGKNGSAVTIDQGTSNYELTSIRISNSNYAAHSMLNGDAFAKKFGGATGDDPDWFKLTIMGYNDTVFVDSVEFFLSDYRFTDNSQDYIVKDWKEVTLGWTGIDKVVFALSSSDVGTWGMNTPAFFALDEMVFSAITDVEENGTELSVYPNPTKGELNIVQNNLNNEAFVIYNLQGQVVCTGTLNANQTTVNVANLANGFYQLVVQSDNGMVVQKFQKL